MKSEERKVERRERKKSRVDERKRIFEPRNEVTSAVWIPREIET
jgi:hypothetical protein